MGLFMKDVIYSPAIMYNEFSNLKVAIKELKLSQTVMSEIELWKDLEHENISKLHEVIVENQLYVVMEMAEMEIYEYLMLHKRLEPEEIRVIFRQLVKVVQYLHSLNIVHR